MYDEEEDIRERSRSPPSRREAEAERKHINRMQHGVNPNSEEGRTERQSIERAERYVRRSRQRAEGLDVSRSPSPPLTNDNLERSLNYEYESDEINRERDTIKTINKLIHHDRPYVWNNNIIGHTMDKLSGRVFHGHGVLSKGLDANEWVNGLLYSYNIHKRGLNIIITHIKYNQLYIIGTKFMVSVHFIPSIHTHGEYIVCLKPW